MLVTAGTDVFAINYFDNGDSGSVGSDISLTVMAVISEPANPVMLGFGFALLVVWQRAKQKTHRPRR